MAATKKTRRPGSSRRRQGRKGRRRRKTPASKLSSSWDKAWRKLHPMTRRLVIVGAALVLLVGILALHGFLNGRPGADDPEGYPPEVTVPEGVADLWTLAVLHLREAPSAEMPKGLRLPVAAPVRQLERYDDGWSLVLAEGQRGYLPTHLLSPLAPLQRAADVLPELAHDGPLTRAEQTELLARLIYSEAGNQNRRCQLYTGSVVLNRAGGDPDRIEAVIFHPGAFDVVTNRMILKEPSVRARTVAGELMNYGSRLPEYVLYFHRYDTDNDWTRKLDIYTREDDVVFAYWPGDEAAASSYTTVPGEGE